jgi:acetyl esterase
VYRPRGAAASKRLGGIVYLHGGGWVTCDLETHDRLCRTLANRSGAIVVAVDYRRAPEHPFPAAVEDSLTVLRWTRDHAAEIGADPARLAVAGDSAGGNLAAVVALKARDGGPRVDFQLLVYPVLECAATSRSSEYSYWVDQYLGQPSDADQVDASPLRAGDLRGLPPTLLLSCEGDPLVPQAVAYARRLCDAGVRAEHIVYPGLIHGAFRMPGVAPAARAMLDAAAEALRRA